jgi:hypothetical protein
LEEAKQEASQLRNRLIQVEKEKEAAVQAAQAVKENGTATNGAIAGPDAVEMLKPMAKRKFAKRKGRNSSHPAYFVPRTCLADSVARLAVKTSGQCH